MKIDSLRKAYISIAVILLNTIVLFLVLNLLAIGAFIIFKTDSDPYDIEYRMKIYPNWTIEEVEEMYILIYSQMTVVYEPYTQFRERPLSSKWVNVDPNGFRRVKNQASWPPAEDAFNIFVFGGSTTFGYGVADSDTIASQIQEKLNHRNFSNKKVAVYNFGRGSYFSSQERILFEKLISEGKTPSMVIFIDGLNDLNIPDHEPVATKKIEKYFNYKNKIESKTFLLRGLLEDLPLSRLILKITETSKSNKIAINYSDEYNINNESINLWLINKKLIEAIANDFGVKTLLVIQPVPTYKYNQSYHLFPHENVSHHHSTRGYEVLSKMYKELPSDEKDNILWLADIQENKSEPLYVDSTHYSANFSGEIADYIVYTIENKNYIKGDR